MFIENVSSSKFYKQLGQVEIYVLNFEVVRRNAFLLSPLSNGDLLLGINIFTSTAVEYRVFILKLLKLSRHFHEE